METGRNVTCRLRFHAAERATPADGGPESGFSSSEPSGLRWGTGVFCGGIAVSRLPSR